MASKPRKTAGRPTIEGGYKKNQITKMTEDDVSKLDDVGKRLKMNRSEAIRFLIRGFWEKMSDNSKSE